VNIFGGQLYDEHEVGLCVCVCVCITSTHAHIHTEFKTYLIHCLATLSFICGRKLGVFASLFQYLPTAGPILIVVKRHAKEVNTPSPIVSYSN
jgi:hypothetical protein